ncbi:MAG: lyase family protein [Ignavibacteria bacterium]
MDVIDTALSVQMKLAGEIIAKDLIEVNKSLLKKAKKYKYLTMIGRTHGVHAEPLLLGLNLHYGDEMNGISKDGKEQLKEFLSGRFSEQSELTNIFLKWKNLSVKNLVENNKDLNTDPSERQTC